MGLWKRRDETGESPGEEPIRTVSPTGLATPAPIPRSQAVGGDMANIGKSISIKGDVEGGEDTVVEGRVEGRVTLRSHHLTIGANGDVQGEVSAKQVTVIGRVVGNVVASERIEVRESGRIEGDLSSPRLMVAEGAIINGTIAMKELAGSTGAPSRPQAKDPPPAKTATAGDEAGSKSA